MLQLPYWSLLADLLEHYRQRAILDPKRTVPIIHVNLVSSVSTLLQQLYKNENKDKVNFLAVAYRCLEILFSDSFSLSYRPAFEHVSSAVDQVLSALSLQITLCKENEAEELNALQQISLVAQVLLRKFDLQLVMAANQKKVTPSNFSLTSYFAKSILNRFFLQSLRNP